MQSTSSTGREVVIPRAELLKVCAVDTNFYCHYFFPKAFRQSSPAFHLDFWDKFEDPEYDYFAAEMFRGSAKTTLTRAGISKRIAYGISRNILSVAISEGMAVHTVAWIRRQMETNSRWTDTFMLQKGKKWSDDWLEIINVPLGITINLVAKGMTSGLRGLNLDDWRPDFIVCDDICNEENTATEEQRNKTKDLFFGALAPSLAPKSEAPLRKFVLLQTGLNKDDVINLAHKDPTFRTVKYPKLIEDENGVPASAWPERFPVAEVLKEKEDYARRNQIHVWLREFGCKIISRETAPLRGEWLREYQVLPNGLEYYLGLDPAISKKTKAHRAAGALIGLQKKTGDIYLVNYFAQQGKSPEELWLWFLNSYRTFRPRKQGVETVAFQAMLAWYFRQKMTETQTWIPIEEVNDRRSKTDRIIQALSGLSSQGRFWISPNHTQFKEGWETWTEENDWDLGDAVAQAITLANPWLAIGINDGKEEDFAERDAEFPALEFEGGAP